MLKRDCDFEGILFRPSLLVNLTVSFQHREKFTCSLTGGNN